MAACLALHRLRGAGRQGLLRECRSNISPRLLSQLAVGGRSCHLRVFPQSGDGHLAADAPEELTGNLLESR